MSQINESLTQTNNKVKIALGNDQEGFHLKQLILTHLQQNGYEVVDYGTYNSKDNAEHLDFSYKVAKSVATQNENLGILICGTGIEVSIAANKVHGIRAALVYDELTAKLAKEVNHANIIALGGRTTKDEDAIKILDAFLNAKQAPLHNTQIQRISEIQKDQKMGKVVVLKHPLIQHKMSIIRDKNTSSKSFRQNVSEVGSLITYELTRDLELVPKQIETPIKKTIVYELKKPVVLVPILRAGLGMVEGIHNLIPTAKIGHVGIYRDEVTLEPHAYYAKFPQEIKTGVVIVVDPMLATGGSASAAITTLKERGALEIRYAGLVGSPQGIRRLQKDHPDVPICLGALDEKLNENGYIVPGLGDCGDRLFGTK